MLRRAIAARAGRHCAEEIDLGKELKIIAWPNRTRLHEVLAVNGRLLLRPVAGFYSAVDTRHVIYGGTIPTG